jgi:hypothetical protein
VGIEAAPADDPAAVPPELPELAELPELPHAAIPAAAIAATPRRAPVLTTERSVLI